MPLFGYKQISHIPSNIDIPGITFVDGDHIEFREEYLDKCRECVTEIVTKDIKEKLTKDGIPAGEMIVTATLNGEERFHSLKIILKNLLDLKIKFKVVKNDGDICVRIEDAHVASFFAAPNKHRIGIPTKSEKVYKYIPDKIVKYIPHHTYPGKEVPIAMEYNVSTNKLNIYSGIMGRAVSEYKLVVVDVGVWVSECEMKAAIAAVTGVK